MRDEKSEFDQVCQVCWNLLIKTKEINKIYRFHGSFKKLSMVVKMQFSNSLAALPLYKSDLLRTPQYPTPSPIPSLYPSPNNIQIKVGAVYRHLTIALFKV